MSTKDLNYEAAILDVAKENRDRAIQKFKASILQKEPSREKAFGFAVALLSEASKYTQAIDFINDVSHCVDDKFKLNELLAGLWMKLGEFSKAIHFGEKALAINPNDEMLFSQLMCWMANQTSDKGEVRRLFESWGKRFMDPITVVANPLAASSLDKNKQLKIGYVSGDLRNHAVRFFIEPYLRYYDHDRFSIHVFMTLQEDEVSSILRDKVDYWHSVVELSDSQLYDLIRKLDIDILVDLSGHTDGERLAVFARRAAPIQVTWFGFMNTLGMSAMDYRLTDWGASPAGSEENYTEKLFRLNCMVSYMPPVSATSLVDSPCHNNGYITMISLNHTRKLGDEILLVWRDILLENPQSGLIVISSERVLDQDKHVIYERLRHLEFPIDRIAIAPFMSLAEFMNLSSVADFALDSYPVSGGTTTLHSVWMGLPVLSLRSSERTAMSSSSANTLLGIGLDDCVATDLQDYKRKASHWINHPEEIDRLRAKCRPALASSQLMDYSARVGELQNAFRTMWVEYVNQATA